MKHAMIVAAVAAPLLMSSIAAPTAAQAPSARPASAQTPPPGLQISPFKACAYRSGSNALTFPLTYRDADGRVTTYVQHNGRPAAWASLGFADARARPWYVNNEDISFRGGRYSKYGLPRILSANEITFAGEHDGQAIVTEMFAADAQVIYVMVNGLECEFQPYWRKSS